MDHKSMEISGKIEKINIYGDKTVYLAIYIGGLHLLKTPRVNPACVLNSHPTHIIYQGLKNKPSLYEGVEEPAIFKLEFEDGMLAGKLCVLRSSKHAQISWVD
jgi:hypothetical protein